MIQRPLNQSDLQKLPQAQRIRYAPRDALFALDPLEEPDQQQAETFPWCKRRTAQLLVIELSAARFAELVEASPLEQLVQP
jgi:hypothetical protein